MRICYKKSLFIVLVSLGVFSLLFSSSVYSQTPTSSEQPQTAELSFDEAYKKYSEAQEVYNKAHEDYVFKRSQYLRFKTLKSQEEAHDTTVIMLQERDNVVIAYIEALKARLKEAVGVSDARQESLIFRLNEEKVWFSEHRDKVPSAGSLQDLVSDSNEASARFTSIEPLFYEVVSNLGSGKIISFTERLDDIFSGIKEKLTEIRKEEREEYKFSTEKFERLDRWIFEADNRIARSKEKQADADKAIADLVKRGTLLNKYNNIITILGEAQLSLKEAGNFLSEVVREIKTAEK